MGALRSRLTASDADADAITQYEFYDAGAASDSGYIWTADIGQRAANTYITVAAEDLGTTWVRGAQVAGSDLMWVRAFDGTSWGEWDAFTLAAEAPAPPPPNNAPVVTIDFQLHEMFEWVQLQDIVSASDADGDAITQYQFFDAEAAANSAYFWTNDVGRRAAETYITVASGDLDTSWIRAGDITGAELMWVRGFDGTSWSEWDPFSFATVVF